MKDAAEFAVHDHLIPLVPVALLDALVEIHTQSCHGLYVRSQTVK